MTIPTAPFAPELPQKFWKIRDAAVEHVLSNSPLPERLGELQEWLAIEGWDDLLAAWINEDMALKVGELSVDRFSDSFFRYNECLDESEVITDGMRVDFARSTIRTTIEECYEIFSASVHSFPIQREDGERAILGCIVESHGQAGPFPVWHGVFVDKDTFYNHLRKAGFLFHSEAEKIGDAEILALWQIEKKKTSKRKKKSS